MLETVVFPRVTGTFPPVRHSAGDSVAGSGCHVVSSMEVPDAVGDGAVGGARACCPAALEVVATKAEGVRSKVKRLAARGWPAEERPGMFSVLAGRAGGS
ncbi:hypothetical protein GCM10010195_58360 [Kitasatospora griseola]|nr:hypothetical protein GCM10010195_58360 [Kitasatospora griseola]